MIALAALAVIAVIGTVTLALVVRLHRILRRMGCEFPGCMGVAGHEHISCHWTMTDGVWHALSD